MFNFQIHKLYTITQCLNTDTHKQDLFQVHPELFFSRNKLRDLNILGLIHSGIFEKRNSFHLSEKVNITMALRENVV